MLEFVWFYHAFLFNRRRRRGQEGNHPPALGSYPVKSGTYPGKFEYILANLKMKTFFIFVFWKITLNL